MSRFNSRSEEAPDASLNPISWLKHMARMGASDVILQPTAAGGYEVRTMMEDRHFRMKPLPFRFSALLAIHLIQFQDVAAVAGITNLLRISRLPAWGEIPGGSSLPQFCIRFLATR